MIREEWIKKIKKFLDEAPLPDEDVSLWQKKITKMSDVDLKELFGLLEEKAKIVTEANQFFINIADQIVEEKKKDSGKIPTKISLVDKKIEDVADIFELNLVSLLKNPEFNIFSDLDRYFEVSGKIGNNVVGEFTLLIRAILENKEILFKDKEVAKVSVGNWISLYNQANDSTERKSIDRINFVNTDDKAKKLPKEKRKILLKFLKLYDYLINPENTLAAKSEKTTAVRMPKTLSTPKQITQEEKNVYVEKKKWEEEKRKKLAELELSLGKYEEGGLERKVVEEEIEQLKNKE